MPSALINVMTGAAEKAGRAILRDFGEVEQLQVSRKGPGDFVTMADRKSEKIIHAALSKARPGFGFLEEEGGAQTGKDPERIWIVDPIDGTTNFMHGNPHWCITIALKEQDKIVAGVVYDVLRGEMFWAERGKGAFVSYGNAQKRLRVSTRHLLEESIMATGTPVDSMRLQCSFKQLEKLAPLRVSIRRTGSMALDLAYVAAGRFEGCWANVAEIHIWDVAAGIVLIEEAGGYVTEIGGGKDVLSGKSILAANSHLHAPVDALIRDL